MKRILFRSLALSLCLLLLPLIAVNAKATPAGLPPGFITLSESRMNWSDAVAYCRQQGGRLPRINNSDSWGGLDIADSDTVMIDAFGAVGDKWPADLIRAYYWTGTEDSDESNHSWGVRVVREGLLSVISVYAHGTNLHVICIP